MFVNLLVFVAALTLEVLGAYMAVVGLSSKSSVLLVVLAISLDFAKIVIASVLYKYWKELNWLFKIYLIPTLLFLMSITSYGSYAYLLQEFSKTTLKQEQIISKLESLEKESAKLLARKQDIDQQISTVSPTYVTQKKRLTDMFSKELNGINERLGELDKTIPETKELMLKNQTETGTLMSLAKSWGTTPDQTAKILALMMVLVIDPLAIILLMVGTFLAERRKEEKLRKNELKIQADLLKQKEIMHKDSKLEEKEHNIVEKPMEQEKVEKKTKKVNSEQDKTIPIDTPSFFNYKLNPITLKEKIVNDVVEKSQLQSKLVVEEIKPEAVVEEVKSEVVVEEIKPEAVVEEVKSEVVIEDVKSEAVVEEVKPEVVVEDVKSEVVLEEVKPEVVLEEVKPEVMVEESQQENVVGTNITDLLQDLDTLAVKINPEKKLQNVWEKTAPSIDLAKIKEKVENQETQEKKFVHNSWNKEDPFHAENTSLDINEVLSDLDYLTMTEGKNK